VHNHADDYAQQVDHICCGPGGSRCRGGAPPTGTCTPACAVAAHAFATDCQQILRVLMPSVTDPRRLGILRFESSCVKACAGLLSCITGPILCQLDYLPVFVVSHGAELDAGLTPSFS
jgi:hypothetical protein